ncbi:beta-L-arabinofuranosidase domain-containing protein [Maribacter sp. 2-571]|uniref:beta-L-arabinofuranosidase domain-containing protein n=1 Tax=Maribacter sp. 2-571 TaxID=3417569 RepID=UPI003D338A70
MNPTPLVHSFLLSFFVWINVAAQTHTKDFFTPLEANSCQLSGHLENNLNKTIAHWSIAKVPYQEFASFFSKGRPKFASGEMWGKAVRAACMFYRYQNDIRLKTLLDETVSDLLTKERANGTISCTPITDQPDAKGGDLWERKYVLLGLERYYTLVDQDPEVLASMVRQTDALISQIGPAPKTPVTATGWSHNNIESSTILEPVMRLYKLTGKKRFLDFAKYLVASGGAQGFDLVAEALSNMPPHKMAGGTYPKAYEMLSFFEGLAEYYRVTGDERIKRAIINMYRKVASKEITIVGNGGNDLYHSNGECWGDTAYEQTNPKIERMMETCVGVTWLKFSSQVLRLTGDPSIADMMERYIYNGLIGAQKSNGDTFSYSNLLNGVKDNPLGWGVYFYNKGRITCCELNGPMGLAYIPYIAVMDSQTGPVVNLYNKGTYKTTGKSGQEITLHIDSDYPKHGKITLRPKLGTPEHFTLSLRIPEWSTDTRLQLNGVDQEVTPGTYKTLTREWRADDVVSLTLDMGVRVLSAPKNDGHVALRYGPLVLARNENSDPLFDSTVQLVSKNGRVNGVLKTPSSPFVQIEIQIPVTNGYITMIDYASSDNWNGRKTCTWLPVK